jgi:DNA-binding XRE family transcriptional regulator
MWNLGDRLRKAREEAALEQGDMAQLLGVSPAAVSKWERGSFPRKYEAVLRRWALETEVSLAWLMGIEDDGPGDYDAGSLTGRSLRRLRTQAGVTPEQLVQGLNRVLDRSIDEMAWRRFEESAGPPPNQQWTMVAGAARSLLLELRSTVWDPEARPASLRDEGKPS